MLTHVDTSWSLEKNTFRIHVSICRKKWIIHLLDPLKPKFAQIQAGHADHLPHNQPSQEVEVDWPCYKSRRVSGHVPRNSIEGANHLDL